MSCRVVVAAVVVVGGGCSTCSQSAGAGLPCSGRSVTEHYSNMSHRHFPVDKHLSLIIIVVQLRFCCCCKWIFLLLVYNLV